MLHSVSSLTRSTIKQALDEFIRSISASKVGSGGVSQSRNGRERAIRRLAGDVELVALGIRVAFLIDTVTFTSLELDALAASLKKRPSLSSLIILRETTTEQVFLIHRELLRDVLDVRRANEVGAVSVVGAKKVGLPIWVDVSNVGGPRIVHRTPVYILTSIHILFTALSNLKPGHLPFLNLRLVSPTQPSRMIPLTALLLEYPVGYVLTSDEDEYDLGTRIEEELKGESGFGEEGQVQGERIGSGGGDQGACVETSARISAIDVWNSVTATALDGRELILFQVELVDSKGDGHTKKGSFISRSQRRNVGGEKIGGGISIMSFTIPSCLLGPQSLPGGIDGDTDIGTNTEDAERLTNRTQPISLSVIQNHLRHVFTDRLDRARLEDAKGQWENLRVMVEISKVTLEKVAL